MEIDYDKKFDILYVKLKESKNSYVEDLDIDDLSGIMKDIKTNEIVGLQIFDFMKKIKKETINDKSIY